MTKDYVIDDNQKLTVSYSPLSGKFTFELNGVKSEKIDKRHYEIKDGENVRQFAITGSNMAGINFNYDGKVYPVTDKSPFYVFLLGAVPLLLTLVLGSIRALAEAGFYFVGGAIGGAIGGLFSALAIMLSLVAPKPWQKILICLGCILVSFAICFGIGNAIVAGAKH